MRRGGARGHDRSPLPLPGCRGSEPRSGTGTGSRTRRSSSCSCARPWSGTRRSRGDPREVPAAGGPTADGLGRDRHRRAVPASAVAAPAERRRTRPCGRRHCRAPSSSGADDPGRLRIESLLGREPRGRTARPGLGGARTRRPPYREGRLPPGAGRAPGGGASRPRRRRAPRGKAWGGPCVVPASGRPRSGERDRADAIVRARPRSGSGPLVSGRLRGGPRSPRRRPGSRWRSETPSPIRASGRRRRTRIGRPAGPRLRAPTRRTTSR